MAFDVGTSGVKGVLTDLNGMVLESDYRAYPLIALPGGGVEQDFG
jgi:sugar (pentulose or hexulose) kinase